MQSLKIIFYFFPTKTLLLYTELPTSQVKFLIHSCYSRIKTFKTLKIISILIFSNENICCLCFNINNIITILYAYTIIINKIINVEMIN